MANARSAVAVTVISSSYNTVGVTSGLSNPHAAVTNVDTSKALNIISSPYNTVGVTSGLSNLHAAVTNVDTSKALTIISSPYNTVGVTSELSNPHVAVTNVDTSKALDPRAPMLVVHSDRGDEVREREDHTLVPSGQTIARLERSGEATKESAEVNLQATQVQVDNTVVGKVQAEMEVTAERKVVCQSVEVTDQGEIQRRQYTQYERYTYQRVIDVIYRSIAALTEPNELKDEKPAKKEICVDFCCQACTCNFSSMTQTFGRRKSDTPPAISKVDFMNPLLRRGRAKGWVMHSEIIFPLMSDFVREILVSVELLLVIIALGFSAATFSLGKNEIFNIVHLALTIIGSLLAFADAVVSLSGCKICRACCCHKKEHVKPSREVNDTEKVQSERTIRNAEAGQSEPGGCKKCLNATKTKLDFARMILAEIILYPLLICDIFELVISEPYKFESAADGFSFVLFVISTLSLLFYVYIMRLAILAGTIYYTQKERKPKISQDNNFNYENCKSAFYFQGYFFYHVMMQMIAQVLMIVAIGAKIRYDNRHLFNEDDMNMNESIRISNYLWYMLVSGYMLPVAGFFTFFIVTYYWVQEFPIGLCIDVLSLLQMPGMDNVMNFKDSANEGANKMEKIIEYIHFDDLKTKFGELHQKRWLEEKFLYPFKSPVMVILCMSYTALQLAFVICAAVVESESGELHIEPLNGGPWVGIYIVSVFVGGIANIYVFTVAFIWTGVIVFILIVIAMTIVLIGLICLLCCCASSSSSNNDRSRH